MLLALACATAASALSAAPAAGFVTKIGATTLGIQKPDAAYFMDGDVLGEPSNDFYDPVPREFNNPAGNPVLHEANVYAIYWDPTYHYHNDWKAVIDTFLHSLGSSSGTTGDVFAVDAQYTDASDVPAYNRVTFRGAYTDTSAYPSSGCTDPRPLAEDKLGDTGPLACLTNAQIAAQLEEFISEHGLERGMKTVYYLLTPPGVTICLDAGGPTGHCSDFQADANEFKDQEFTTETYEHSFCSYHADINPSGGASGDGNTIIYGVIPWIAGGKGDGQLAAEDSTEATYCQDGAFDPASEPIEQRETTKLTEAEQKKFAELDAEEKVAFEELHPGPHEQEPNQVECPSSDGYCDTGLADLEIGQIASEQQDIVTDPLLNAWMDPTGNEAVDECRNFFAPAEGDAAVANPKTGAGTLDNQKLAGNSYYVNDAFNLAALRLNYPGVPCLPGVRLEPKFTAPNPVNSGVVVGFDAGESDITLNAGISFSGKTEDANYARMTWNFGDGTPEVTGYAPGSPPCESPWASECAESVFHSYSYGGTYTVTITAQDVGGFTASESRTITVIGPPRPSSGGSASPQGSGGSSSTGSTSGASAESPSGGAHSSAVPAPQAIAKVASTSLKNALSGGLVVDYYVSEQVAGHFEVLLSTKLAKGLGISGAPAVGLPAGSEPQTVIARALLVTLKGGHSEARIRFSKKTAKRLAHLKQVSVELRLVVRNAATQNPATATVISAVTLTQPKTSSHAGH